MPQLAILYDVYVSLDISIPAPSPVPYTLPEANALIFSRGISQDTWQLLRNGGKARNANIYPTYNSILEYRKSECTPMGIQFGEKEVTAPMQEVLDHQMRRLLDDPQLTQRVSVLAHPSMADHVEPMEFIVKYGFDGFSQVSRYCRVTNSNESLLENRTNFGNFGIFHKLLSKLHSAIFITIWLSISF